MMPTTVANWQALCFAEGELVSGRMSDSLPAPGSAAAQLPTTQVELCISARNLLDLDVISKSDPQCVVFLKDSWQDRYYEIGKTETVDDNLNPDFVKKFLINFNFEMVQKMKFELWDIDPVGRDFLGQMETTLADIVANKGRQFVRPLTGVPGKNCGEIVIVVEEVTSSKQVVTCQFKGHQLKKTCWLVSNDPFLMFWKTNEDNTYSLVHKTESCNRTQKPAWIPFSIKARTLCNGDFDRNIRVDCLDFRYSGDHQLIGSFYTTVNRLITGSPEDNKYQISNDNKGKNAKTGIIELVASKVSLEVSFLDYIRGGMEMNFAVAIDFTASNGNVTDPRSLHHIDPYQQRPNAYEIALRSVGEIISHYDSRGMFPGFGFGAKLPPNDIVSHQFPLNGNPVHPYCQGVDGLVGAYKENINRVILFGPTNFSPVINSTAAIARQHQDGKSYFVLLIITDGIICDMPQTKYAIVTASVLPLSIIIVGVGSADFTAMDELDSDDSLLAVDGHRAARDIVQFVPMNKFLTKDGSWVHSQIELAREVLYEVPDQIVGYMKMKGFKPNNPPGDGPTAPGPGSAQWPGAH